MEIINYRYNSTNQYTDGLLMINGKFECYTLEDEARTVKVFGETRIPNGRYKVELRTVGGTNEKYLEKFGADFHKGMLWVKEVPNFQYILIHIGNTKADTAGCLLVGSTADKDKGYIGESTHAYKDFYPKVAEALLAGEEVYITYKTL